MTITQFDFILKNQKEKNGIMVNLSINYLFIDVKETCLEPEYLFNKILFFFFFKVCMCFYEVSSTSKHDYLF